MNKNVDAGAISEAAEVASGAHVTSGVDAHAQHDYRSARVDDFVKDVGVDELGMLAGAQRADQSQLMFMTTYMNQQTLGMAAAWQAMRHFEADENQRLRHADTMQSMTAAVVGEMVEAIANRVCDRMRAG